MSDVVDGSRCAEWRARGVIVKRHLAQLFRHLGDLQITCLACVVVGVTERSRRLFHEVGSQNELRASHLDRAGDVDEQGLVGRLIKPVRGDEVLDLAVEADNLPLAAVVVEITAE